MRCLSEFRLQRYCYFPTYTKKSAVLREKLHFLGLVLLRNGYCLTACSALKRVYCLTACSVQSAFRN